MGPDSFHSRWFVEQRVYHFHQDVRRESAVGHRQLEAKAGCVLREFLGQLWLVLHVLLLERVYRIVNRHALASSSASPASENSVSRIDASVIGPHLYRPSGTRFYFSG